MGARLFTALICASQIFFGSLPSCLQFSHQLCLLRCAIYRALAPRLSYNRESERESKREREQILGPNRGLSFSIFCLPLFSPTELYFSALYFLRPLYVGLRISRCIIHFMVYFLSTYFSRFDQLANLLRLLSSFTSKDLPILTRLFYAALKSLGY